MLIYGDIKNYVSAMRMSLLYLPVERILKAADILEEARESNIYTFGNGGSMATAIHLASDLSKQAGMRAFALNNISAITAYANDQSYDNIFSAQLEMVQPCDICIAISCSGNSKNVINGVIKAKELGAVVIGLMGFDGGELKELCNIPIVIASQNMEQIEDIHLVVCHIIVSSLRKI